MRLTVSLAFAALTALTGCTNFDRFETRDPTAGVRQTLDERAPLRAETLAEPTTLDPTAAEQRAVRGFVKRGEAAAAPALSGGRPAAAGDGAAEISLNFEEADLVAVIRVIMDDGLQANYVIHPDVTGRVSIRTNRPLTQSELLATLEEILRLNDAALIEAGGVYRIVPRAEAGLSAPLISSDDVRTRGLTVRVTPLRFVTVEQVANVLEGFAPVSGSIRFDPSRNIVFSIGTAAEQATIMDVIATLDVNYFVGRSFGLRPLREADPQIMVDELETAFAPISGGANAAVRFMAIDRMNAVLIIADEPTMLDEALGLIRNLDQGGGETPRLYVFQVRERRAGDLAQILGDIFGAEVSAPEPRERGFETGFTDLGGGDGAAADPIAPSNAAAGALGAPTASPEALRAAEGEAAAAPRSAPRSTPHGGVIRIVADETSNSLVALATADGARALENALRQLDVQPLQVMIEATLVEVELNDQLEYGIRWFFETGNFQSAFGTVAGGIANTGGASIFPGFNVAFRTGDAQATIQALDEITNVAILSSPTLMVLDNEVARLQIGDQVPVTVRSSQSTNDPDAPIVNEQEFRDTGVILQIRPTVNSGGNVILEVRQEASDVVETAGAANPTFNQRVVESTISVQSGDTIALAGLIEENNTESRQGIPVLSRLPIVGALFGVTTQSTGRTELMVLIRPIVVRDQAGARAATAELRSKLGALAPDDPNAPEAQAE